MSNGVNISIDGNTMTDSQVNIADVAGGAKTVNAPVHDDVFAQLEAMRREINVLTARLTEIERRLESV